MHTLVLIIIYAALWWLLSGGSVSSWVIGLPVVFAATWISRSIMPRQGASISLPELFKFSIYFVVESIKGGLDVTRRTLSFRMDIQPHFYQFQTQINQPTAKILFCACVSLLPGTLYVTNNSNEIEIHALSKSIDMHHELLKLEQKIIALFKLEAEKNVHI